MARIGFLCVVGLLGGLTTLAATAQEARTGKEVPTLFIIGDSTVRNNTKGQVGWGDPIAKFFDMPR